MTAFDRAARDALRSTPQVVHATRGLSRAQRRHVTYDVKRPDGTILTVTRNVPAWARPPGRMAPYMKPRP